MEKFDEFRDEGRTLMIVTHALGSIQALCDRAYWLRYGVLEREGAPTLVAEDYAEQALGGADAAGTTEARFGSGELQITRVRILDSEQRPADHVRTGDDLTVHLEYVARTPVQTPVFSLEVTHATSGVVLAAPTTRDVGLVPAVLSGSGTVEICLPRLALLPGRYELTVACSDFSMHNEYDHRSHVARFEVERGDPSEERGLISLRPAWKFG